MPDYRSRDRDPGRRPDWRDERDERERWERDRWERERSARDERPGGYGPRDRERERGGGWGQGGMEPGRGIRGEYEGDDRYARERREAYDQYDARERDRYEDDRRREEDVRRGGYGGDYGRSRDPRYDAREGDDWRRRQMDSDREWRGYEGHAEHYERERERQRGPEEWSPYRPYRSSYPARDVRDDDRRRDDVDRRRR